MPKRKRESEFSHEDYTVGWVCAITTEYIAAQEFLDEEHEPLESLPNDTNDYALGRVGKHNVVIAVLPEGQYGIANATSVANNMVRSFPHLRIGLMVGIGGGVPSERHDVRLGDVVVSTVTGSHGAVFQYDYGKAIQGQEFQATSFINQPPALLQTAVSGLRTQYERKGSCLHESVEEVLNKNRRLRNRFQQPDPATDRFYLSTVIHGDGCCADTNDPSKLVDRTPRTEREDDPMVHYGLIASANQVMKDAVIRDSLSRKMDVLCFEMEAAGLMNQFPCLIIRGICDYSDTHKNKEWQGYAAMTAAAYTRGLLYRIQPSKVNIEKRLSEFVNNANKRLENIQSSTNNTERLVKAIQTDNRLECLRQWLDPPDPSVNFNKAIELRQAGSGLWLLQDSRYLSCKNRENSLLWLHGIPGCGKTVLSTTIIQDLEEEEMILYFYFDFNDTRKQTFENMIRSLCYQLYRLKASQRHLDLLYSETKDGQRQPSTESLENTFLLMIQDVGKIYILLDALDESSTLEDHHTRGLLSWIDSFRSSRNNVHLIATSRPEHAIQSRMKIWAGVIPVALESHLTEGDINSYIVARVGQLSRWHTRVDIQNEIIFALSSKANGMYRWVSCQFDTLKDCRDPPILRRALNSLPRTLDQTYSRILASVPLDHRHYTIRLLQFLTFSERPLRIEEAVDAIAVNTDEKPYFNPDDRMPAPEEVLSYCSSLVAMTNRKGQNAEHESENLKELSLAHFSVKEYLISDRFQQDHRMNDIRLDFLETNARASIVKVCVAYLLGVEALINIGLQADGDKDHDESDADEYDDRMISDDVLLKIRRKYPMAQYSAQYWPEHARVAKDSGEGRALIWDLMKSAAYKINWSLYDDRNISLDFWSLVPLPPGLYYASLVGLSWLVEGLLEDGADINAKGNHGTALHVAVYRGHDEIVHLLLQAGADADAPYNDGDTPLHVAARRGAGKLVQLLLEHTTNVNVTNGSGTPLRVAARRGNGDIVRCLLEHGADVNAAAAGAGIDDHEDALLYNAVRRGKGKATQVLLDFNTAVNEIAGSEKYVADDLPDVDGITLLQEVVRDGHIEIIEQLLEHGADINGMSLDGTALRWAVSHGNYTIVQLLTNYGADLDLAGRYGGTPLQAAVYHGHSKIVQCLLENGADADLIPEDRGCTSIFYWLHDKRGNFANFWTSEDTFYEGNTPLCLAALHGRGEIVQQLLNYGADVNAPTSNYSDETVLERALAGGQIEIAQQLIEHATNSNTSNRRHESALYQAVARGFGHIVKQLLDLGAKPNVSGDRGTALHEAVNGGHEGMIQQLIDHGADIDAHSKAHKGTPLCAAVYADHSEIVRLLLQNGANVNGTELSYGFALHQAAMGGKVTILQQLLDQGADVNVTGYNDDSTALQAAVLHGRHDTVLQLLQRGAKVNEIGNQFHGPALTIAAAEGYSKIVCQLLDYDADLNAIGGYETTALLGAVSNGHSEIVQLLLDRGADVNVTAGTFGTPLQTAMLHNHHDIVKQLRDHEASRGPAA
ncbi:unnamed protein product [Clonostachys byssicola]|uniref:Nephrocystin 3-like N-terminal domain-containing protein n=1 Tax=Clonostachys byssicola TaxID=160290 RepID=A0A9N9UUP8_9HYPO|nr:unnamed protein product [Clonostachys byssicola]